MDRVSDRSSRKEKERDRSESKDHHHRDRRDRDPDRSKDDRRHRSRTDFSPEPPESKRERDSAERDRDSAERVRGSRIRISSSRKRKDHDADHLDRKKSRASDEARERRKFDEDREEKVKSKVKEEGNRDGDSKEKKREARRFSDSVKEEMENSDDAKQPKIVNGDIKNGVVEKRSGSTLNEPLAMASEVSMASTASVALPTKVSSITTTENKGVSVIRSDEVHGKSSTDGTTTTIDKSGSFSLDALAKAKLALQKQKEISEKLKKLNKIASTSSEKNVQGISNKDGQKVPPLGVGGQNGHLISTSSATPVQATPSVTRLPVGPGISSVGNTGVLPGLNTIPNIEAVKRAQELAAKMGYHHDPEFAPLINMFPGPSAIQEMAVPQRPSKAPVLRLDAQGREIDEHGNVINMPKLTNLSTLKVNINKQKKEAFQILRPELDADTQSNPHFDGRMGINKTKLLRPKRMNFQFVEEGKWSKQAEITKIKNQFGEAQSKELKVKQSQLAKAKAEPDDNPNLIAIGERVFKEKKKDEIPEIEWWDKPLLASGASVNDAEDKLNMDKITIYVEHPRPIEPPAEPTPPPPQPLKLTKKEQKKLRTQRRLAKERDRQEMIRQGLLEPPKSKVKMSNLMKVLGSEATQDPTKLEYEIRSAALEREQAHVDRNIARKLTPAERREKKERKLFEDPNTVETLVSVYKIKDLSHPQTRFKVDVNAQENRLTGCAVISDGISVVVVEGGKKSIKRYGKLMLNRIDWAAAVGAEEDGGENGGENVEIPVNRCDLVWQGSVAKPSFNRFLVHQCRSDAAARKVFADTGVPHYWDLAVNFGDEAI